MAFAQSCMRFTLFVFNFIYLCVGGAALGIGIYAKVKDNHLLIGITRGDLFPIILMVIGSIVVVISLMGFCGALKMSKGCLLFYSGILTVMLIVELGLALAGYFMRNKLKKAADKNVMLHVKKDYPKIKFVKNFVDSIQEKMKCCGYNNYTDWVDSKWRQMSNNSGLAVPETCCIKKKSKNCNAANERGDIEDKSKIYAIGCRNAIQNFAEKHMQIILITASCVAVVQMIGVILGCCLMSSA